MVIRRIRYFRQQCSASLAGQKFNWLALLGYAGREIGAQSIRAGDMFLVYSAVIDLVSEPGGDSVFWKTTRVVPHKIRPLRKAQGRFAAFVNDAIAEVKPDKVLVARKPENLGARTDP